jgi:hypothetical protein
MPTRTVAASVCAGRAAEYAAMDELIAFLTANCCQGGQCLPRTAAANTIAKRRRKAATEENCS